MGLVLQSLLLLFPVDFLTENTIKHMIKNMNFIYYFCFQNSPPSKKTPILITFFLLTKTSPTLSESDSLNLRVKT